MDPLVDANYSRWTVFDQSSWPAGRVKGTPAFYLNCRLGPGGASDMKPIARSQLSVNTSKYKGHHVRE